MFVVLLVTVPVAIGAVLAAAVGGWTSIVVALIGYVALVAGVALTVRFAVRSWRPVRSLMRAAGRVADGDYEARARTDQAGALTPMLMSFNRMAERLESAESDRRRLLADIGHELRTPLTIIRGELEAMVDGVHPADPVRMKALLGDIAAMEHLLDDLRTLSTAEAGMLRIHREPTDLARLVEDAVERFRAHADASGVELRTPRPGRVVTADVDPVRVREIVGNLVRNAVRATPPGGTVDVAVAETAPATETVGGTEAETATVTISVADTGRGIPADDLDRVFRRFHKGPDSDGTGLGLTISRNLVEAHGGTITLDSAENEGTTVTVTLPTDDDSGGGEDWGTPDRGMPD